MTEVTSAAAGWDPQTAARLVIAQRIQGWMHRDLGEWTALRDLFHPEAMVDVSWFNGTAIEFVEA
ncbi:hypothetical protein [Mycobacterium sp. E1747]|uniref:hypothetical protein n=1 Tax=Mycobacterium sp. E1747 TaxID=1834128 RepID=UPI000A4C7436|nr:hypothetical protein [Mycobacterium sp. E1747]